MELLCILIIPAALEVLIGNADENPATVIFSASLCCTMFCPDIAEQFRTVRLLPFVLINAAVHLCYWLIRDTMFCHFELVMSPCTQ
jgi:hypothetical protein